MKFKLIRLLTCSVEACGNRVKKGVLGSK